MKTRLFDRNGKEISAGDFVSLGGNMTTDDSFGFLPNGWNFDEEDVYEVYWDERIDTWSLKLGVEPDNEYNIKYMNHAVSLLHDEMVEIVGERMKPSQEWSEEILHFCEIIDPDGWDRKNFDASWQERITKGEFLRRLSLSTISCDTKKLMEWRKE